MGKYGTTPEVNGWYQWLGTSCNNEMGDSRDDHVWLAGSSIHQLDHLMILTTMPFGTVCLKNWSTSDVLNCNPSYMILYIYNIHTYNIYLCIYIYIFVWYVHLIILTCHVYTTQLLVLIGGFQSSLPKPLIPSGDQTWQWKNKQLI